MKYLNFIIIAIFLNFSTTLFAKDNSSPTPAQKKAKNIETTHGIAIFGDLKYPANFSHFDYVNPNALKDGKVKLGAFGSYDNFNSFIIKGNSAAGASGLHCTLLASAEDEPMSSYGYLAEKVHVASDRKSVVFTLNKEAKFSDGSPVTADDVIFSFNTLKQKGLPMFAQYYKDVKNVEKINDTQVKFEFSTAENRELPVILGQLPIFSKAYYTKNDFEKATLVPPIGCGPYKVASFKAGQSINYVRVPNWWGKDIPSQKGLHNFDINIIYYRDQNVMFEAFKSGDHDFRAENIAKNWATGYKIPAVQQGKMILKEEKNKLPQGMQLLIFNMRKSIFMDRKVREALAKAFDFEWANKNLFFNSYTRSLSFFSNSDLASAGLPQGEELKILEPFKDELPPEVFTKEFKLPITNASGQDRKVLSESDRILKEAGWIIKDGKRILKKTGERLTFEILMSDPSYERLALAIQRNMAPLGVQVTTRTITPSQYIERIGKYDYDMILQAYPSTETPGNELREYWGSKGADIKNGYNFAGLKNPVVDKLIDLVISSPDRPTLLARTHALDRVMLWQFIGIPTYHSKISRIAYWNKFGQPKIKPKDGVGFSTWWIEPELAAKLGR